MGKGSGNAMNSSGGSSGMRNLRRRRYRFENYFSTHAPLQPLPLPNPKFFPGTGFALGGQAGPSRLLRGAERKKPTSPPAKPLAATNVRQATKPAGNNGSRGGAECWPRFPCPPTRPRAGGPVPAETATNSCSQRLHCRHPRQHRQSPPVLSGVGAGGGSIVVSPFNRRPGTWCECWRRRSRSFCWSARS
jgi:hypothetical protein